MSDHTLVHDYAQPLVVRAWRQFLDNKGTDLNLIQNLLDIVAEHLKLPDSTTDCRDDALIQVRVEISRTPPKDSHQTHY